MPRSEMNFYYEGTANGNGGGIGSGSNPDSPLAKLNENFNRLSRLTDGVIPANQHNNKHEAEQQYSARSNNNKGHLLGDRNRNSVTLGEKKPGSSGTRLFSPMKQTPVAMGY